MNPPWPLRNLVFWHLLHGRRRSRSPWVAPWVNSSGIDEMLPKHVNRYEIETWKRRGKRREGERERRCEYVKMWVREREREDVSMWRCEDEQMWRWADVKMRRCEDKKMWRWADVKMSRCENEKMWRWEDVKMSRCEDEQMWRCADVKMWRWEGVKMRRCEDEKVWRWEGVKMRRWDTDPHYWKNPALRRSRGKKKTLPVTSRFPICSRLNPIFWLVTLCYTN